MTETTDFVFPRDPPPPGISNILTNNSLKKDSVHQLHEEDEVAYITVPSELLKEYHCGCNPCWHPQWLQQLFARKKVFTALLCCFAFLQGAIVSGFTSVILSTIQKRYNFSTTAAGFVAVSYDASVTISVIFISYFGGKSHKPRWLGISLLILALGSFIFALPQFVFGSYQEGSSDSLFEGCRDSRNFTVDCSRSDIAAYSMFILGNVFIAVGAAPLFTVGQAYIDEIVLPKYVPIHIGVYHMMSALGPAFGYAVGSSLLSLYVDPWESTSLTTTDPAWVGAWWMSFILAGLLAMLLAIPFLMFPRYLPDSHLIQKERAKEMAKIYSSKYANEDSLTIIVKMFPVHIKRLLLNPSFMFSSFGLASLFIMVSGLVSFAPKYFETQFHLTATFAGLLAGGVGIASATFGICVGALILFFFKIKGKRVIFLVFVIIAVIIPVNPAFLIHCPQPDIAGITVPFVGRSDADGIDSAPCANECDCLSHVYEPVCGADGLTYFSSCRAGCISTLMRDGSYSFDNCSCVAVSLNDTTNGSSTAATGATSGLCSTDCIALAPFIVIIVAVLFLVFITQIPFNYFTMRVVADDQRSLALGLQSAIWRIFGTIPGPLIFGALFDSSCLQWQDECGNRGNCWIYDNRSLSIYAMSFGIPCLTIAAVLFFLSWLTYPRDKKTDAISKQVKPIRPTSLLRMRGQQSESEDALLRNGTTPNVCTSTTPSDVLTNSINTITPPPIATPANI